MQTLVDGRRKGGYRMQRHQKVRPTSTEEKELKVDFLKIAQDRESVKAKKKKKKIGFTAQM